MVYSGIYVDLDNRYRLNSVLCIGQCTLQYCVSLFDSVLKIFSFTVICDGVPWDIYRFGKQI